MKTSIFFFFLLFLISCEDKSILTFAHNEKYVLDKDEKVTLLSKIVLKENEYLNSGLNINVPLNKFVKAKNYSLAINIALDDNIEKTLHVFENDTTLETICNKTREPFYMFLQKKDSFFILRNIYLEKEYKMPIILTYYSLDSIEIKNVYDKNKIIEKIKH